MSSGAVSQLDYLQPSIAKAPPIKASLLTGGFDKPYAFGLAMALAQNGIVLDVIGNKTIESPEMYSTPGLTYLTYYWDGLKDANPIVKFWRVLRFYLRVISYAAAAKPRLFHILWNNKFPSFDRTLLMLYYKMLGKKIAFTAHNVNAGLRDGTDSALNRLTLKVQYHLADHIFVHTEKMKTELLDDFGVSGNAVTVIPFGINNSVPNTDLTPAQARQRLGIPADDKVILFFGGVRPYKGLEYLVDAFNLLKPGKYRLIIAGEAKKGTEKYMGDIQEAIRRAGTSDRILQKLEYIPDEDAELYFKASDVCVLPYTIVFQSGVLFLAYSFGLPVIATDVGSLADDIIPGKTGSLCRPCDAADLARAIEEYFGSELYRGLDGHRNDIRNYALRRNSWNIVGDLTRTVYTNLLAGASK